MREVPVEYGITRKLNPNSFLDVYFGEIVYLIKDVRKAPGIKNKLLYIVMPPGWDHEGNHRTATQIRKDFLKTIDPRMRGVTTQPQDKILS